MIAAPDTPGRFCTHCGQTGNLTTLAHHNGCPVDDRPTHARLLEVGTRVAVTEMRVAS